MDRLLKEISNAEIANKSLAHELQAVRASLASAREDARIAREETQMLQRQRIELGREISNAMSTNSAKDREIESLRKEVSTLKTANTDAAATISNLQASLESAQMSFADKVRQLAMAMQKNIDHYTAKAAELRVRREAFVAEWALPEGVPAPPPTPPAPGAKAAQPPAATAGGAAATDGGMDISHVSEQDMEKKKYANEVYTFLKGELLKCEAWHDVFLHAIFSCGGACKATMIKSEEDLQEKEGQIEAEMVQACLDAEAGCPGVPGCTLLELEANKACAVSGQLKSRDRSLARAFAAWALAHPHKLSASMSSGNTSATSSAGQPRRSPSQQQPLQPATSDTGDDDVPMTGSNVSMPRGSQPATGNGMLLDHTSMLAEGGSGTVTGTTVDLAGSPGPHGNHTDDGKDGTRRGTPYPGRRAKARASASTASSSASSAADRNASTSAEAGAAEAAAMAVDV